MGCEVISYFTDQSQCLNVWFTWSNNGSRFSTQIGHKCGDITRHQWVNSIVISIMHEEVFFKPHESSLTMQTCSPWQYSQSEISWNKISQNLVRLMTNEILRDFIYDNRRILIFCTEHGSMTAAPGVKFQRDSSIKKAAMDKRDLARFEFKVCCKACCNVPCIFWLSVSRDWRDKLIRTAFPALLQWHSAS